MKVFIGRKETEEDMLRSILSQLDYRWQINSWLERGVNFKDHLYVPEVHPETGLHFCEREDEGHVFKVCKFYVHVQIQCEYYSALGKV